MTPQQMLSDMRAHLPFIEAAVVESERYRTERDSFELQMVGLLQENKSLTAERDRLREEKDRRIYYQSIVYNVCNQLDKHLGKRIRCGTIGDPSTEVQDFLSQALKMAELARCSTAGNAEQAAQRREVG